MNQPDLLLETPSGNSNAREPTIQRTLKIEAIGEFFHRRIKPRIRLSGYWLEQAGFKPGHRVKIHLLKPGEMTLQFKEETPTALDDRSKR